MKTFSLFLCVVGLVWNAAAAPLRNVGGGEPLVANTNEVWWTPIKSLVAGANITLTPTSSNVTIAASGSGSGTVASGFAPLRGAVATNGSTFTLFSNVNTNKTIWVADGDSQTTGQDAWFAILTNGTVGNWAPLAFATNAASDGDSVNTNDYTVVHPWAPGAGTNGYYFHKFNYNGVSDAAATILVESNIFNFARADGFYVVVFKCYTSTNDPDHANKFLVNAAYDRALAEGRVHFVVDTPKIIGSRIYEAAVSDDGLHLTTYGQTILARYVDALLRAGPGNSTHPTGMALQLETTPGTGTNVQWALRSPVTGGVLLRIDSYTGAATFSSTVTGGFGIPWGWSVFGSGTTVTNGTGLTTRIMPRGFTVTSVLCTLATASTSGSVTVDVKVGGSSIFSVLPSIDVNEQTSSTGVPGTITSGTISALSVVTTDVTASGLDARGLDVWFIGTWAP